MDSTFMIAFKTDIKLFSPARREITNMYAKYFARHALSSMTTADEIGSYCQDMLAIK